MRMRLMRVLPLFLAVLMLGLTILPASAAVSATASAIRLMKYTGTVNVTNSSGRTLSKRNDMLLYSGYQVETKAMSYAWLALDDEKLAKLDAVSKVEVRKSGKKLELLLKSGHLYFNISKPLDSDETLNICTSTMIVGIRGTSGFIRVIDRWSTEIYVLEGTVQCSATDPVTGQVRTEEIRSGEKAVATAYPQDREGVKCDIIRERFESGDIDGFVLTELAQDPGLCDDISGQAGLDLFDAVETAQDRLEQDEQGMQDTLDSIEEELAGQDGSVSSDAVWKQEDPAPSTPGTGGTPEPEPEPVKYTLTVNYRYDSGAAAAQTYTGQFAEGAPYSVTSPAVAGHSPDIPVVSGTMSARDETVTVTYSAVASEFRMPKTAQEVQDYLTANGAGSYTLLANSSGDPDGNTLTVDIALIIPNGTTLELAAGINVTIDPGGSLTVDGTMRGDDSYLTNNGTLTVNSSNTLEMDYIENNGSLINAASGRIVANTVETTVDWTNAGTIVGSVTVSGGTFTMSGGAIEGGNDGAVTVAVGASFIMTGGEIISSDTWATVDSSGSLELIGGTISNSGAGYAVSVASAGDVEIGAAMLIRAKRKDFFVISDNRPGLPPDTNAPRYEDGYYRAVMAEAFGECGDDVLWDYSDGVLTITGEGAMEDFSSSTAPWSIDHQAEITVVVIGNGVTGIGETAFENCSSLARVTIPKSVETIGNDAFSGCSGLTGVYYGGTGEEWTALLAAAGSGNDPLKNAEPHYTEEEALNSYALAYRAGGGALTDNSNPFADVPDTAWYSEAVRYVYERGLMNGTGGGAFSPDIPMSRGMFVTILHRMEGLPSAASGAAFSDVPAGRWYTEAVAWASENQIVLGYNASSFGPNDPVTREQMAVLLCRYAVYKGYNTAISGGVSAFADGDSVSLYAIDAVNWAIGTGLLQGAGNNMLAPSGVASRSQAAAIVTRFYENAAVNSSNILTVASAMDIMCEPSGIQFMKDGSFLVTDTYNKVIWQVSGDSSVIYAGASAVYAGADTVSDPYDRPIGGYNDSAPEDSYFRLPWAIVPFLDGYAVSDADNNVVRLVLSETIQTVNGTTRENLTVTNLGVVFDHPTGLAADEAGNLYVSDTFAGAVRKITPEGYITTFVRDLTDPTGLCWKDGALYIAETGANRIVKTTGGQITVVAGSGEGGLVDGAADQAAFHAPKGVAVGDDGTVYISDTVNGAVRQIKNGMVTTLAIRDGSDLNSFIPISPMGLAVHGDQLYVCDNFARKVFIISLRQDL